MMHPDSKASRVLAVLLDGPATTSEVAAETGIKPNITTAHLLNLMKHGQVSRTIFPTGDKRVRYLWAFVGVRRKVLTSA